ncbi:MAG: presqualene diphosphate synthase HpnD [Acidobacteriota bacterium]
MSAPADVTDVARSSGSSFYYAFLTLPRPQREAIQAVYAFCHAVDDAVDEAPDPDTARRDIARWRDELARAYEGRARDPIARRIGEIAGPFGLPRALFEDVIDGVSRDLDPRRFVRWDELAGYCDLVAGAVGRLCVRIFGRCDEEADRYARALGRAFQLTNILRDLGPDAALGRFYLPLEDLERFGVSERDVVDERPPRMPLLMFEADRARALFDEGAAIGRRDPRRLCAAEVMAAIYRRQLDAVVAAGFPARRPPARLSRARKVRIALGAWLRCRLATGGAPGTACL